MEVGRNVSALIKSKQVSTLIQPTMPKKFSDSDPNTFSAPCIIGKSLILGALEPIGIVVQLANKSIAHLLGILKDMLVQTFVLDMKDELSSKGLTLILGKLLLKTTKTKINVHGGTLSMEFGDNRIEYTIFEAMKHSTKNHSIFYVDVIDQLGDNYMNLHSEFPYFDDFKDCDFTYT
ncbi:hypothetical protein CR513_38612, partial [Mucuna pruriens]